MNIRIAKTSGTAAIGVAPDVPLVADRQGGEPRVVTGLRIVEMRDGADRERVPAPGLGHGTPGAALVALRLRQRRSSVAKRIGTPKFEPPKPTVIAKFTPSTSPLLPITGPPEPPEVVSAS